MLLQRDASCLVLIDIQERLLPAMADPAGVVKNTQILLRSAATLGVPVLASEQYAKGLGPTVAELANLLPADAVVEKLSFSCLGEEAFAARLRALDRRQVVVVGIEAHVCVLQTADPLVAAGYDVFVVADATSSRVALNHELAMARLARCGCSIVTTEMVVFEWLQVAGTPEFKALSALVR
jgi:nicotinamidase-related amidase